MGLKHHPKVVTNGLVMYVDAANTRSYSGTGLTTNGLVGGVGGALVNGTGFSTTDDGYFIFDGSNDYINFGNSSLLQQSSGTISAWTKTSAPGGGFRGIIAKQLAYGLFYADSVLVTFDWGTGATRSTGLNISDNTWKNVVMTYQSGVTNGTIVYLNGVSVLTTTITIFNQTSNLFGGAEANASQYAACQVASFNMYSRVLTPQEILQNYNALKRRYRL
jgi:hypothetical protein